MSTPPRPEIRPEVQAAIDTVTAVTDPVERFHATRQLTEELKVAMQEVKRIGQGVAVELKAGRTMKEVGLLLDISTARVDQVLKGR